MAQLAANLDAAAAAADLLQERAPLEHGHFNRRRPTP